MALPAPGKLPRNTPISDLGFSAAQLRKMTPAARKLTKGDLVALNKWSESGGKAAAPARLTIADLQSLQKASGSPATLVARVKGNLKAANGTTYCCCCSPCCTCTAAAEIAPVRLS
jgi:hypothetical protein